jgi:magnesium transporter
MVDQERTDTDPAHADPGRASIPRTRCYRDGRLVEQGFPVETVSDHLAEPGSTVWFDLSTRDRDAIELVREELGLHELAVEDTIHSGQRPKLDHYAEHLFLVMYAVEIDPTTQDLRTRELAVFVTKNAVVTVHNGNGFDIDAVLKRWDGAPRLAGSGVAFLLHGLLDYVVDSHYEAVTQLDTELDALEEQLFDDVTDDTQLQRRTFAVRKTLVNFRRLVLPMREVVNALMRRDLGVVDAATAPYFQDVYDHVVRVGEWTESLRDLLANILETRLTVRGNRLNVIMKQVTSWAAIIAVPTAVTGFYGQNVPYPGFGRASGLWASIVIIAVLSGGLYALFRRKDWL